MDLAAITDALLAELDGLSYGPEIPWVYNPLRYARRGWDQYADRYGRPPKEIVLVGMNPGPWGMAQTGVPFGEVSLVRDWLGIEAEVTAPPRTHPKKPVTGFSCPRSEVSGRRLWGWAKERFTTPERFFARFFVANYCPLLFLDSDGRNITPDRLPTAHRAPLFAACDRALQRTVALLSPRFVVGVGRFAAGRCRTALADHDVTIGCITHPSPANPRANQGWTACIEAELAELGITLA